ncbi:hypothetical protein OESDEN_09028 [Oesophagostomum dentatum]|uniref:Uncharacterized protein n=1 Tax=Oesophagostomum dentatum TaxID=61180 RepID=A0A0B1T0Q0_OESDE|nr:hypothetical protein OESDEN_09028 [Oesophagostomum dentatum]
MAFFGSILKIELCENFGARAAALALIYLVGIHGTFDDDGVFHPDGENEKSEDEQVIRNQIQGTKIREFSQAERDTVDSHAEENTSKGDEYSNEESAEGPSIRESANAVAHQLAEHDHSQNAQVDFRPAPQREPRYPPFIFRPRPPPPQRDTEYNNLLAEIEEYDDFLEQQRIYRSRYPLANLQNPYRELPAGQLPAAGSYSAQGSSRTYDVPAPRRISQGSSSNWTPQQPQQQQWSPPVQQQGLATEYPKSATENPLLNLFKIFSSPHAFFAFFMFYLAAIG